MSDNKGVGEATSPPVILVSPVYLLPLRRPLSRSSRQRSLSAWCCRCTWDPEPDTARNSAWEHLSHRRLHHQQQPRHLHPEPQCAAECQCMRLAKRPDQKGTWRGVLDDANKHICRHFQPYIWSIIFAALYLQYYLCSTYFSMSLTLCSPARGPHKFSNNSKN